MDVSGTYGSEDGGGTLYLDQKLYSDGFPGLLGTVVSQLISVQESIHTCQENSFEDDSGFDTSERLSSVEKNLQILIQEIQSIDLERQGLCDTTGDNCGSTVAMETSIMENISLALSNLELNRERMLSTDGIRSGMSGRSDDYSLERMVDELFRNVRGLKKILVESRMQHYQSETSEEGGSTDQLTRLIELVSHSYSEPYHVEPTSGVSTEPMDSNGNAGDRQEGRRRFTSPPPQKLRYTDFDTDEDLTDDPYERDEDDGLRTSRSSLDDSDDMTSSSILEYGFIPVNYVITGTISNCNTPTRSESSKQMLSMMSLEEDISSEMEVIVPARALATNTAAPFRSGGRTKPGTTKQRGPILNNRDKERDGKPRSVEKLDIGDQSRGDGNNLALPELPKPLRPRRDMLDMYQQLQDDMTSLSRMVHPEAENSSDEYTTETSSSVRRVLGINHPKFTSDDLSTSKEFKTNSFEGILSDIAREADFVNEDLEDYESRNPSQVRRPAPVPRIAIVRASEKEVDEDPSYHQVADRVRHVNRQLELLRDPSSSYRSPGEVSVRAEEVEWDTFTPHVNTSDELKPYRTSWGSESTEGETMPRSKLSLAQLYVPDIQCTSIRTVDSEHLSEISKLSTPTHHRMSSSEADLEVKMILQDAYDSTGSELMDIVPCTISGLRNTVTPSESSEKVLTTEDYIVNDSSKKGTDKSKTEGDKSKTKSDKSKKNDIEEEMNIPEDNIVFVDEGIPDILKLFTKENEDGPYRPNKALLNALLAQSGLTIKPLASKDAALNTSFDALSCHTPTPEKDENTDKDTLSKVQTHSSSILESLSKSEAVNAPSQSSSVDHTSHISDGPVIRIIKDKPSSSSRPNTKVKGEKPVKPVPSTRSVAVGRSSPSKEEPPTEPKSVSVSSAEISSRCNKPRILLPPKQSRASRPDKTLEEKGAKSEANSTITESKSSQTTAPILRVDDKPLLVDTWTCTEPLPDFSEGVTQTSGYETIERSCSPIVTIAEPPPRIALTTKPELLSPAPPRSTSQPLEHSGTAPKRTYPGGKRSPGWDYKRGDLPDLSKGNFDWDDGEEGSETDDKEGDGKGVKTPKFRPPTPGDEAGSSLSGSERSPSPPKRDREALEKALLEALYNKPPPKRRVNPDTLKRLQDQLTRHKDQLQNTRDRLLANRKKMSDMFNMDREGTNPLESNM